MLRTAVGNYPLGVTRKYNYQTLWGLTPPGSFSSDNSEVVLGTRVRFEVDGAVVGARFFQHWTDHYEHWAMLLEDWNPGVPHRAARFHEVFDGASSADSRWHNIYFRPEARVTAGMELTVAVWFQAGQYWRQPGGLSGGDVTVGDLTAVGDGSGGPNGIYTLGNGWDLPFTFGGGFYGIDVLFRADSEVRP